MTDSRQKITREQVKGLPEGALIQQNAKSRTIAVFFPYNFRDSTGRKKQERDYIGTVKDGVFCPNAYYLTEKPTRDNRPVERWSDPVQRARAAQCAAARRRLEEGDWAGLDFASDEAFELEAGASALAVKILYENGFVEDAARALSCGLRETMDVLNLGILMALGAEFSSDGVALLSPERVKLIGKGFAGSACTAERLEEIGRKLSMRTFIERRFERFCASAEDGSLTIFEGRAACPALSALPGQEQGESSGRQIAYGLLCGDASGMPLGLSLLQAEDHLPPQQALSRSFIETFGLQKRSVQAVMSQWEGADASSSDGVPLKVREPAGCQCIAGICADEDLIRRAEKAAGTRMMFAPNLLDEHDYFGIRGPGSFMGEEGRAQFDVCVYFSPDMQMRATSALREELRAVNQAWMEGSLQEDDERLKFFEKPYAKGEPLKLSSEAFDDDCRRRGYFAVITDAEDSLDGIVEKYLCGLETESFMQDRLGSFFASLPERSRAAQEVCMLAVLAAVTVFAEIKKKILDPYDAYGLIESLGRSAVVSKTCRLSKSIDTLTLFQPILLAKNKRDYELRGVWAEHYSKINMLGCGGFFDDAEALSELLSARRLSETISALKQRDASNMQNQC